MLRGVLGPWRVMAPGTPPLCRPTPEGALGPRHRLLREARATGRRWRGPPSTPTHSWAADFCSVGATYTPGSSSNRQARMSELIGAAEGPLSVEDLQGFFRDHAGYPGSICSHVREGATSKTVASLISEPAAGRLHA